ICSVVAVFKMLIRILNTLPSRIRDMVFFLFSDYAKSTVSENGDSPEGYVLSGSHCSFMVGKCGSAAFSFCFCLLFKVEYRQDI
ncbi:hypothetical protein, partial [Anaerobutyricum hallii]|uniref:hypothetical protein n=2 Tax=Anaerobutyricum TaxID=2569097 RepID=UPI0026ED6805